MNWRTPLNLIRNRWKEKNSDSEKTPGGERPTDTEKDTAENIIQSLKEQFTEVLKLTGDVDTLIDNIQYHLTYCGKQYALIGMYHGEAGTRDFHIRKITDAHATMITERVISVLSAQADAHGFIIGQKEEDLATYKKNHSKAAGEKQEQEHQAVNDGKQYHLFNAWIYLISGLAMILADIAVSINLVAFFGVGNPKATAKFWDKIGDLELSFFALGIALCTVFIKIFYDEYINNKLGQNQLQFIQLEGKGIDAVKLRWEFWVKLGVKSLILFSLMFLLYYLAKYRTYFTIDKEFTMIDNMKKSQNVSDISEVIMKSFIGITVVIPVISGIALSGALKIFSNRSSLKKARAQEKEAAETCNLAEAGLQSLIFKQKQIEKYHSEWQRKGEKIELESVFFAHHYDQGFRYSYREHHGNDLYKLIEEYRNEIIHQAFTKQLKIQS